LKYGWLLWWRERDIEGFTLAMLQTGGDTVHKRTRRCVQKVEIPRLKVWLSKDTFLEV
jgi:hypothetical protein